MQARFINFKVRQMVVALLLKPVEVGHKNGRDFNARNVRQHQPGIIVVVIGHAHASFIGLFKDGNGEWGIVIKQMIKGVNSRGAGADNRDLLHQHVSCVFSIGKA